MVRNKPWSRCHRTACRVVNWSSIGLIALSFIACEGEPRTEDGKLADTGTTHKQVDAEVPAPGPQPVQTSVREQLLGTEIAALRASGLHEDPPSGTREELLSVAKHRAWLEHVPERFDQVMVKAMEAATKNGETSILASAGAEGVDAIREGIQALRKVMIAAATLIRDQEVPKIMKRKMQLSALLRKEYSKALEVAREELEDAIDDILEYAVQIDGLAVRLEYALDELQRVKAMMTADDIGDIANAESVAAAYSEYLRRALAR